MSEGRKSVMSSESNMLLALMVTVLVVLMDSLLGHFHSERAPPRLRLSLLPDRDGPSRGEVS